MFVFKIFTNTTAETLCYTCVNAQVVEGKNGERLTSCAFGWTLRNIKFHVADCSSYIDKRNARAQTVVTGFVVRRNRDAAG